MAEPQLVRHKVGKLTFEALTRPGQCLKWRNEEAPWSDVLFAEEVFKHYAKGERARGEDLRAAFETEDKMECLKIICRKGALQESAAERREKVERKRAEVLHYIHKYYVNPQTNTPHPEVRLSLALDEAKIHVDAEKGTEEQAHEIVKKLLGIVPLKKSEMEGVLTIPRGDGLGAAMGVVHKWCTVRAEKYHAGGGVSLEISLTPGDFDAFTRDMGKVTHGEYTFDLPGTAAAAAAAAAAAEDGKHGKGKKGKRGK